MVLSNSEREAKLQRRAELEGFDTVDEMFDAAVTDSACPGICINPGCDHTTEVEPDQRKGYCENCGTQTVKSCLVLAGLIRMSRVRELNDAFRTTFEGGRVLITAGVGALPPILACEALQKVRTFTEFTPDNDPYGEHDSGGFDLASHQFLWRIDCYDKSMTFSSEDPADPEQTTRVLTIVLAEDH